MAGLVSDRLRHFRHLFWNNWTEFIETWQGPISQRPLPCMCFPGRSENQDSRPGFWFAETISTSLQPLNGIQWHLTGSKNSTSSTNLVFWADRKKKMAAPVSDWLRHFRFLWNRLMEFAESLQEVRTQRPLPCFCFSANRKTPRWSSRPLIGLNIFVFLSETAEQNLPKLYRK